MPPSLTDEQAAKLRRLRDEFPFFSRNCLKIRQKDGTIVPFVLNRAQEYIHGRIEQQLAETGMVRTLLLKGRQQGASTYTEGRFYHRLWKTTNQALTAFILTHQDQATSNIYRMAQRYHELTPDVLRPSLKASNAMELAFALTGSRYAVGTAGSKAVGRSFTAQLFHGSEVAFWPNAADHLAGLGQAIPNEPGTEIILESTANGTGNVFHQMWQDARSGKSRYLAIFVPWFWQPEYRLPLPPDFVMDVTEADYAAQYGLDANQIAWRRAKIAEDFAGDGSLFDQEYPAEEALAFMRGSDKAYIPLYLVNRAMATTIHAPSSAVPRIMGVDPAEYGDDDTSITMRQGRKVWQTWRHHGLGPMEVAGRVAVIFEDHRKAGLKIQAINVDCTGVGSGVADRLIEQGYPVNRVHFGGKPNRPEQYSKKADEMWGEMKKWLEDEPCDLPDNEHLRTDLTSRSFGYDSSRRLVMESKEKMKARGVSSPDDGDSLALTFAIDIQPEAESEPPRRFNGRLLV